MTGPDGETDLIRVVLADANVLYSRVLRDYLLYAADQEVIAIARSPQILAEVTQHLEQNVVGFDRAAGERLVRAMNDAFPFAEVEPRRAPQSWCPRGGRTDGAPAGARVGRLASRRIPRWTAVLPTPPHLVQVLAVRVRRPACTGPSWSRL